MLEEQPVPTQQTQAAENLAGDVAHDINNLLGVIIGNLDLLAPRLAQDAHARGLLQDALDAAVRGADLTSQLLAFAQRQPVGTIEDLQPAAGASPSASVAGRGGETVLVVEDNVAIRRVVVQLLNAFGYRPVEADGPAAAAEILEREQIDVLLTDIVMPGDVDGVELARRAKANQPSLKILLTSGVSQARLAGRGDALCDMRLLSKPYRQEDLARTLREILQT